MREAVHIHLAVAVLLALAGLACRKPGPPPTTGKTNTKGGTQMSFQLTSAAFDDGEKIPRKYAYAPEGQNLSPALQWTKLPPGTVELALLCDDPDAPYPDRPRPEGPWNHWVVYGIDPSVQGLEEGVAARYELPQVGGAKQGVNSFGEAGYGGPMPPEDSPPHRYRFKLYALDTRLDLEPGVTRKELLGAMDGHIIATAELTGMYER